MCGRLAGQNLGGQGMVYSVRRAVTAFVLILSVASMNSATARPAYPSEWQNLYEVSGTVESASLNNLVNGTGAPCQLCHQNSKGGDGWNAYGWEIKLAFAGSISAAIVAAEGQNSDSDPDGQTNSAEINADSQPGWTDGAANTIYYKNGDILEAQLPPQGILGDLDTGPVGAKIGLSPASLEFGEVGLGSRQDLLSNISNLSSFESLTISAIQPVIDDAGCQDSADFTWEDLAPVEIPPSASQALTVTYTPPGPEPTPTTTICLDITSNDPDSPTRLVVTGKGVAEPSGVDLDIVELQVAPLASLADGNGVVAIELDLLVTNGGVVNGSANATIVGLTSEGAEVYQETQIVSDNLGGGDTSISFTAHQATSAGKIAWTATIADENEDADQFNAVTEVMDGPLPVPLGDPIPEPIKPSKTTVSLELISDGLVSPVHATSTPAHPDHLFVVDQPGIIYSIDLSDPASRKETFLDVRSIVYQPLGIFPFFPFDERGLLGFAFHPDYATNGLVYTYTSEAVDPEKAPDFSTLPAEIPANHQAVISEWKVSTQAGDVSYPMIEARRELLRIDQPQFNHNGGTIAFGPDKMLYITFGDGGGADDVDGPISLGAPMAGHGNSNGQDAGNPLGALLRIDPLRPDPQRLSANGAYGIPADNPFVGDAERLDEIYAYGLRNMYRFSFDRSTGALYGADVGQNDIEEVNIIVSGGNYGWNLKEGSFFFEPNGNLAGFVTADDPGDLPADLIDPILEYDHDEGISITGGYVYRGRTNKTLEGGYIFADWSRSFYQPQGRLLVYFQRGNRVRELLPAGETSWGYFITGFGEDNQGEIYVLGNKSAAPFTVPNQTEGAIFRLVPSSVTTENSPPQAGFSVTVDGLSASFTDSSIDPDGSIASYGWDFGDGLGSSEPNPVHLYAEPGTYMVRLTVVDNEGAVDSVSQSVTVTSSTNGIPVLTVLTEKYRGERTVTLTWDGGEDFHVFRDDVYLDERSSGVQLPHSAGKTSYYRICSDATGTQCSAPVAAVF